VSELTPTTALALVNAPAPARPGLPAIAVVPERYPSGLVAIWQGRRVIGMWSRTRFRRRLYPSMPGTPEWTRALAERTRS
jgi:hypothetical protein